ncbi:MAG: hypothetical protein JRI25_29955 [Deltaproteobacteria bacterium]|nr:hypothetical protein [Deltaproteobacteria bacterium]
MGIDHGLITHFGRWVLAEVGIVPKALHVAVREQLDGATRNTSAIPAPAMIDTCEFLEEDCADTHGLKISFPVDEEGAEHAFFPAVSDYLLEPDTLMGNAAVMAATGGSWTIGTKNFDGINYGSHRQRRGRGDAPAGSREDLDRGVRPRLAQREVLRQDLLWRA